MTQTRIETQLEDNADSALTQLTKADALLTAIGRGANNVALLGGIFTALSFLKTFLFWVPIVDAAVMLLMCMLAVITVLTVGNHSTATRAVKCTIALSLLAIVVVSFVVPSVAIPIALFALVFANRLWDFACVLHNRLLGDYKMITGELAILKEKLTQCRSPEEVSKLNIEIVKKENMIRVRNGALADSIHAYIVGAITLTGTILLMPPFTAIGLGILFGIGVYGVLEKFEINPLRWIGNKIFNYPFAEKKVPIESKPISTTGVCEVRLSKANEEATNFLADLREKAGMPERKPASNDTHIPSVIEQRVSRGGLTTFEESE